MKRPLVLLLAGFALTLLGFLLQYDALGRLVDLSKVNHDLSERYDFFRQVVGFVMIVLGPLTLVGAMRAYTLRRQTPEHPSDPATPRLSKASSGCMGAVVGGIVGSLVGLLVAIITIRPGQAAGVEAIGYFAWPFWGALIGAPAGLLGARWLRTQV
jgi:hypothetical protein